MLQVALYTGLRKSELFRLEDRDLDFEHGLILLRNPKGGRDCSVPLTPPVAEILRDQIAWRNEVCPQSTFIFPGRGGRMRTHCNAARRIKAAAQLPEHFRPFHGLRHNFAVAAINSGEFTLDLVGQLLTHKKAEVTRRYAQFLPATLQAASARAANIIQAGARKPPEPSPSRGGEVLVEPTPRPRRKAKGEQR